MTLVAEETKSHPGNGAGTRWALVPVALLVASTVGVGSMASIAARDPGFALEKDYYARAVDWDHEQAQRAENQRLGYTVAVEEAPVSGGVELAARVVGRSGEPVNGAVVHAEAFANARSADRRELAFVETAPGSYRALLPAPRAGVWELRFVVTRDGDRFTESVRQELVAARVRP